MRLLHSLALLAGATTLQFWHALPPPGVTAAGILVGIAGYCWRPVRLPALCLLGAAIALTVATIRLEAPLAPEVTGEAVELRGTVVGLPVADDRQVRFRLRVEEARVDGRPVEVPRTVRLGWFGAAGDAIRPGERWQLMARLSQPRGWANPGGFDFPRWLFREGIGATGQVLGEQGAVRLDPAGPGLDPLRYRLRHGLVESVDLAHEGTLSALAIGDRGLIDDATWEVLLATGTNHLLAISGLHVGLAALAGFGLGRAGWYLLPSRARQRWPRPIVAAITGLVLAAVYAALAGFAIPTQRALIMLAVVLGMTILRRASSPGEVLALALAGVLVIDPLAPMAPGFWLSFAAVAIILWTVSGRIGPSGRLRELVRLQIALGLALSPLLLLLFARTSIAGPLANLVAVPWVSLLVVPPTVSGALISPWLPGLGSALLQLADLAFTPLWWLLKHLAEQPWAQWRAAVPGAVALGLAIIGCALLLAPRGVPGKAAGLVCLLPLVAATPSRPAPGHVWLDLLDVGEGVAAVVRTTEYTLVVDTGPRRPSGFDAGAAAVTPFLRAAGSPRVDDLVITQGHRHHSGGAESVIESVEPNRVLAPGPDVGDAASADACREGMRWRRDGVEFTVLHPRAGDRERLDGADHACVLRIAAPGGDILLVSGLGERAQWFMLTRDLALTADVLVTQAAAATVEDFAHAVSPEWVLHAGDSGGPHTAWPPPWAAGPAGHARSDCRGALRLHIGPGEGVGTPASWHERRPRFWQRGCDSGDKSGTMPAVMAPDSD